MHVEIIKTASLGNRGYLVHDGTVAVAVDVQRDFQRWTQFAKEAQVKITHVLETHMHNDYVTGGYKLAQEVGALYVVPTKSGQSFTAHEVQDDEVISVGKLTVRALHTPGHTPHHMSYEVVDGVKSAVFTGGGVLYGTVGRPDLISKEMTQPLAEAQYESAQKLVEKIEESAQVFPTHGFGSFCSSAPGTGADASTLAEEKKVNIAYTSASKQDFITTIIAGLGAYPRYYAHMGKMNQDGPSEMTIRPIESLDADQLKSMLAHDEWVIDIRDRKAYAASHPKGAAGFEMADSFSTYLGWLIPWGDALTLVGDSKEDLEAAQIQLGRIGMDQFVAHATDDMTSYFAAGEKQSYKVKNFEDLKKATEDESQYVLDVRTPEDWKVSHIKDSVNIPLYDLLDRVDELPKDQKIWVHCASGYRASIAASLLDRSGRNVVLISDTFSGNWE
ncbi:MAG TPA: MBL fold metallo-hydrolase [Candidatus Saccharibacteria bacterium]|jgi:hydroxyacylglutathione hydrolase|nr:MBL fold metallo-hydrolase [Candidatus Saccharibacteria bacterium]